MRGVVGREEDAKFISPMFPRLHVNDADKGGPRAPPRNKMALYEQLSVPSKRFKHASLPTFPMPAASTVPSASSSMGCGSASSSYYPSPLTPSQSSEMTHPCPFGGNNSSNTGLLSVRRSVQFVGHGPGVGSERLQPASANGRRSQRKESEDDDDFRVPTFVQTRTDKDQHVITRLPSYSADSQRNLVADNNPSIGTPEAHEGPPEHSVVTDCNDRLHQNYNENPSIREPNQKFTSHVRSEETPSHSCNAKKVYCNPENTIANPKGVQNSHQNGKQMRQGSGCNGNFGTLRCLTNIEDGEYRDSSSLKRRRGYEALQETSPSVKKNRDVNKTNGPVNFGSTQRNCEVSVVSNVDSDSGLDISPDDVVGVIGPKHFWKARRAIINQQRIFAVQVFELHRLIKVQKLLAASPDILLEGNPLLHSSSKVCVKKNKSSDQNGKSLPQNGKGKDDSQKTNISTHSESTQKLLPLPTKECDVNRNHVHQVPQNASCPGNMTPIPTTLDNRTNPWCFQPTNNQWLIPVMSPSEGLVYKPYMGPCPPSANFMAPMYGGYGPLAMPPITGDFMNPAAYGIPASYPQNFGTLPSNNPSVASPHCFPAPYGHPLANTTNIAVTLPSKGSSPNDHTARGTFDSPNHRDEEARSGSPSKMEPSWKEGELHGSSTSSPNERPSPRGRDGLRFTYESSSSSDQSQSRTQNNQHCSDSHARVIRVVPLNAESATESAARIFRFIQEERQQLD